MPVVPAIRQPPTGRAPPWSAAPAAHRGRPPPSGLPPPPAANSLYEPLARSPAPLLRVHVRGGGRPACEYQASSRRIRGKGGPCCDWVARGGGRGEAVDARPTAWTLLMGVGLPPMRR